MRYMKKANIFFAATLLSVLMLFLLTSCENQECAIKNVEKSLDKEIDRLDDKAKGVAIQLETTDHCLLSDNSSVLHVDSTSIFVVSSNNVYRFARDGRFLNVVGRKGNGFGEHGQILSCSFNPLKREVYIGTFGNFVVCYKEDGTFLRKIQLKVKKKEMVYAMVYNKVLGLVGECRQYLPKGISVQLVSFDDNGKIKQRFNIYEDSEKIKVSRTSYPILWNVDDKVSCKLAFDDYIYTIGSDGKIQRRMLGLQALAPDRKLVEDMDFQEKLLKEKCQVLDLQESNLCYYLVLFYKMQYRLMVVDKQDGEVLFNSIGQNPKFGGGIKNKNMHISYWPKYTDGKVNVCVVRTENLNSNPLVYLYSD